ncbi:MAG: DUF3037 domain-containing protein [Candidatus Pseudobacter hemicellulosilyticus]|uniref:DUF3037 domain-containing protein n=1 Tax=Candidatus Pseudobacter hemicellulosilyticus TaxID=3121375 RepID=A0AAJ5WS37_9BACT|nr:MAG: DUF3037 domain-containing protein [Pseudobacter sp.]
MQDRHLFEYAIVRVVPRVEREEFLNVGVILYCRQHRFLQTLHTLNEDRLRALCSKVDMEEVKAHLLSFEQISQGGAGPIGQLDIASRFRWLTATRSTILQTSKVHPGLCTDPLTALQKMHAELVL